MFHQLHRSLMRQAALLPACIAMGTTAAAAAPDQFPDPTPEMIQDAAGNAADLIVSMQEGENEAEWPYEGVYRTGGQIPIGYRIGGTAICAMAVIQTPDLEQHDQRTAAVERATRFVLEGRHHPLMDPRERISVGYDVRGWGYTYALQFLVALKRAKLVPENGADDVDEAIRAYIDAIQITEIPIAGGWNYAGAPNRPYPMSPFMTAPTLQALFAAAEMGFEIDADVIQRALEALDKARERTGAFVYSGSARGASPEPVPGSPGRMMVSETTLLLAGRGSVERVRGAVDAFFAHWEHFDARRARNGTHAPPFGIAPYYFYYAHYYAAQAIEQLPQADRPEYRRRLARLIFRNRIPDGEQGSGGWNDRVFPRSANYGSAMCIMALLAPESPAPAPWKPKAIEDDAASNDQAEREISRDPD